MSILGENQHQKLRTTHIASDNDPQKTMNSLNIKKLDLEQRLGIRGKFTNPNKGVALILGISLTCGFFLASQFFPASVHEETWLGILTQRGLVPYFTLGAFLWGFMLIWMKSRKIGAQSKALKFLLHHKMGQKHFHAGVAKQWLDWIDDRVDQPQAFILINRLKAALSSLATLKKADALPALISSHAESDEVQVDESYAFPSMLLFVIPVLGFIGTVLGLSSSIGGFGKALNQLDAEISSLVGSLQGVTNGLSVAFDTTLFALICALLLQVYISLVRSKETQFMEDCNTFFQNEFLPNLTNPEEPDNTDA